MYSSYSQKFSSLNSSNRTITIPIPELNEQGQMPEEIDINLKVRLRPPHEQETSRFDSTNSKRSGSVKAYTNTKDNPSARRYQTQCNMCSQSIPIEQIQSHFIQHKLSGNGKKQQTYSTPALLLQKYSTNGMEDSMSKNYKKLDFGSLNMISQYTFDSSKKRNMDGDYPVIKTTDLPLDELIQGIKLDNRRVDLICNEYAGAEPSYCDDRRSTRIDNPFSPPAKKNTSYNFERKSTSRTRINQKTEQDSIHQNNHSIQYTKRTNEDQTGESRVIRSNKKLSLCRDIEKQMFFKRQSNFDTVQRKSTFYKLERENSKKRIFHSCTKLKVPINILAQQDTLVSSKMH